MAGPATAGATGADTGPPVITAGVTCTPSPPVGVAAATGDGVSTGTCAAVNPSPPLRVGMDVAGVVANGGGAGVSAADPGSIACIAPSEKDCRPGTAGCPVGTPVANGCPIGPGAKPCPTVAGEKGLLGTAGTAGAIGAPVPGTDGLPTGGAAGAPAGTGPPLPPQAEPPGTRGGAGWLPTAGTAPAPRAANHLTFAGRASAAPPP